MGTQDTEQLVDLLGLLHTVKMVDERELFGEASVSESWTWLSAQLDADPESSKCCGAYLFLQSIGIRSCPLGERS